MQSEPHSPRRTNVPNIGFSRNQAEHSLNILGKAGLDMPVEPFGGDVAGGVG
jgi:hypothetical protein